MQCHARSSVAVLPTTAATEARFNRSKAHRDPLLMGACIAYLHLDDEYTTSLVSTFTLRYCARLAPRRVCNNNIDIALTPTSLPRAHTCT